MTTSPTSPCSLQVNQKPDILIKKHDLNSVQRSKTLRLGLGLALRQPHLWIDHDTGYDVYRVQIKHRLALTTSTSVFLCRLWCNAKLESYKVGTNVLWNSRMLRATKYHWRMMCRREVANKSYSHQAIRLNNKFSQVDLGILLGGSNTNLEIGVQLLQCRPSEIFAKVVAVLIAQEHCCWLHIQVQELPQLHTMLVALFVLICPHGDMFQQILLRPFRSLVSAFKVRKLLPADIWSYNLMIKTIDFTRTVTVVILIFRML